jgi:transcription antitermination factor NusG
MSGAARRKGSRWFICRVFPARQMEFIDHCVRFGVSAYTPFRPVLVKPRNKRKPVREMRPAFPGYVFVAEGTVHRPLFVAPGYSSFVVFGGEFASVSAAVVEDMKALELGWAKEAEPPKRATELFDVDQRVKLRGLFDSMAGTVRRITRNALHVELDARPGMLVDMPPDMAYPI